jgi:hypothetical protein
LGAVLDVVRSELFLEVMELKILVQKLEGRIPVGDQT